MIAITHWGLHNLCLLLSADSLCRGESGGQCLVLPVYFLLACLFACFLDQLIDWLTDWLVDWLVDCLLAFLLGQLNSVGSRSRPFIGVLKMTLVLCIICMYVRMYVSSFFCWRRSQVMHILFANSIIHRTDLHLVIQEAKQTTNRVKKKKQNATEKNSYFRKIRSW